MGVDSGAIFICLRDIIGANRDQPAISNLELTMELNEPFSLPAVLGTETSAAQHQNHRMLSLEFGELPAFGSVIGKLVVGEDNPWNNVRSHVKSSTDKGASRVYAQSSSKAQRRRIELAQRSERFTEIADKEFGLFPRGEVAAFGVPVVKN